MRCFRAILLTFLLCPSVWARYPAALVKDYTGRHQEEFTTQYERVRLLVKQAQLEVSARLGLIQYQEGFQYPLFIRFDDGAPPGVESALAYVQLMQNGDAFAQQLVVNMDATSGDAMDFDKIFYHEMTHAVMNDAVGGDAAEKIPHWVQEGLAQYVSGEGPGRVKDFAQTVKKSQAKELVADLESPYTGRAYPQYYLAIQYMNDKFSVNAIQALVRELILGKSTAEALQDSTGQDWVKFQDDLREYSIKIFEDNARPDF
jgi:hypothetical protein